MSFRDLQRKCEELKLYPCRGRGITISVLKKKIASAEKKVWVPKKVVVKTISEAEIAFHDRDPVYYETIKDLVPKMPDLRYFQTETAKKSLVPWTDQKRWAVLLDDFETLDQAEERGDTFDSEFIEWLALLDSLKGVQKTNEQMYRYVYLRDRMLKKPLAEFFAKYPALSWILIRTDSDARRYALFSGYDDWVKELDSEGSTVVLDNDAEKILLAANTRSPDLIRRLLDIFSDEDLKKLKGTGYSDAISALYHMGAGNAGGAANIPLLNYLIDRGFRPNYVTDIIRAGDVNLIKKMEKVVPVEIGRYEVDAAVLSRNPDVVRYIVPKSYLGDPYHYLNTTRLENIAKRKDLEMLKAIGDTGGPIEAAISEAVATPGAMELLLYLIDEGVDPIEGSYPHRTFRDSIYNPEALAYLIDNYYDRISDEYWRAALSDWVSGRGWHTERQEPPIESLKLLLDNYDYTEAAVQKVHDDMEKYGTSTGKRRSDILLDLYRNSS